MRADVFGMWVESNNLEEVAREIVSKSSNHESVMVVTPNVDHFLRWKSDKNFRYLYKKADYCLIDGMPILWLARLLNESRSERITGIDLSLKVLEYSLKKNVPIAIIGGSPTAMLLAKKNLNEMFPGLNIFLTSTPSPSELTKTEYLESISKELSKEQNKVVLLCLGSPKQEQLYADLSTIAKQSGSFLCVGGTIDFIASTKKRAPIFVQRSGFEWLYRFAQEPKRLFYRYFVAGIKIIPFLLAAILISISRTLRSQSR